MEPKDKDLHHAHVLSVLAILQVTQSATDRLTPEQLAEVEQRMADGTGRLVMVATNDGTAVHVELTLADSKDLEGKIFDRTLLVLDGPVHSPAVPPDNVTLINPRR